MPTPITGQGISAPPKVDATLSNTSKNAVQNQAVANALAGAYDATVTYAVGDLCIYDGILYECTIPIATAEAWDATHWKTRNFGDTVSDLNRHLNDKQDAPSTDGTAGQVLGLDSQLRPVWVNQSGGGGDVSNCAPIIINTASGDIASFADGADNRQIKKIVGTIVPVQSGTGDPSPDNVRPISGWTGANIEQRGKNLLNNATPYKSITAESTSKITSQADLEAGLAAGQMLFYGLTVWQNALEFNSTNQIFAVFKNMPLGSYSSTYNKRTYGVFDNLSCEEITRTSNGETPAGCKFTVAKKYKYVMIYCHNYAQSSTQNPWTIDELVANMMVAVGNKVGSYAPYAGTTLPINWQSAAGTIYGGTVTLNEDGSADVVSDHILAIYNGSEAWGTHLTDSFMTAPQNWSQKRTDIATNYLPILSNSDSFGFFPGINGRFYASKIVGNISGVTDISSWKSYLSSHNLEVYYEITNPQTYHLTNIGQLYTYLGTNNVWIDTGAITECDYPADTKTYVDENGGGAVSDVQINGTSILSDGVANIPIGTGNGLGVVRALPAYGMAITNDGLIYIVGANQTAQFKKLNAIYTAVTLSTATSALFYALAKLAGDATLSASDNPLGTYTEGAKSAIHEMLNGAVTVSGTTPTIAAKDGITYICGEVATLDITLPASGIFEVQFVSGSTPTVLTVTGVSWVNGFDPTTLEANKTYEINILNGIGVAAWT